MVRRVTVRDPQVFIERQTPERFNFSPVLDHLRDAHGGAEAWLRERGWSEEDVARLRSRLLD